MLEEGAWSGFRRIDVRETYQNHLWDGGKGTLVGDWRHSGMPRHDNQPVLLVTARDIDITRTAPPKRRHTRALNSSPWELIDTSLIHTDMRVSDQLRAPNLGLSRRDINVRT